jgi:hypothetical protein
MKPPWPASGAAFTRWFSALSEVFQFVDIKLSLAFISHAFSISCSIDRTSLMQCPHPKVI